MFSACVQSQQGSIKNVQLADDISQWQNFGSHGMVRENTVLVLALKRVEQRVQLYMHCCDVKFRGVSVLSTFYMYITYVVCQQGSTMYL